MNPTTILGIGGGLAVILLIVGILVSARSERTGVDERIGRYVSKEERQEIRKAATTPLTDWITRRVDKSTYGSKIATNLARANLRLKTGEYFSIMLIAAAVVGILFYIIGRQSLIAVSYTHLRAHETPEHLVCRLLLEKKK